MAPATAGLAVPSLVAAYSACYAGVTGSSAGTSEESTGDLKESTRDLKESTGDLRNPRGILRNPRGILRNPLDHKKFSALEPLRGDPRQRTASHSASGRERGPPKEKPLNSRCQPPTTIWAVGSLCCYYRILTIFGQFTNQQPFGRLVQPP